MGNDAKPIQGTSEIASQAMEQTRGAMESYFSMLQKGLSAVPWAKMDLKGDTELNKKLKSYAEQNIAAAFELAQKLTRARNLQDLVQIQTEFMQTQLKSLGEQAKDLGETAAKAATDAITGPFKVST
jgi:hypothetical protein